MTCSTIAINLSARTLQQGAVVSALHQALDQTGISPSQLTLKIAETSVLTASGSAQLGLTLVAEGVDRPSQAALLRQQGCDAALGGLFGRPLPAEAIDRAFGLSSAG